MQNLFKFVKKIHSLILGNVPALFFIGGFLWDALTIGKAVKSSDLIIFSAYLLLASYILYHIALPEGWPTRLMRTFFSRAWFQNLNDRLGLAAWPFLALQFLFGSLLSALFILYFNSSSYALAWIITLVLGVLLVANEFLHGEYRKLTLCWGMLGLCAMLLFNFCLPFLLGSIHAVWFYLSTLLGAGLTHALYLRAPKHMGSIWPVWLIAGTLMLAYMADMVPPVPLVKREVAVAYDIKKAGGKYLLTQQATPWWVWWPKTSNDLTIQAGQPVYFFSAIFAPSGLQTKLYHHWQWHGKQGWVTQSRVGFNLNGGRNNGYRGYTVKHNLRAGEWRVRLETEADKTLAVQGFEVAVGEASNNTIITQH